MTNIPSDEDFARANKLDDEEWRGLDAVNARVEKAFKHRCPLHYFYLMPQRQNFRAYVFFNQDKNIEECKSSGIAQEIIDFVYEELERAGRGKRDEIEVAFEFDSDENVTANFEGDYFLRLR